jgi:LDH2 family malate/lactate/ureidoglycolate dehydrogenase
MDNWIYRFRSAKTVEGQSSIIIPGDPEREFEKERRILGIPLSEKVVEDLKQLGEKLKIPFPV